MKTLRPDTGDGQSHPCMWCGIRTPDSGFCDDCGGVHCDNHMDAVHEGRNGDVHIPNNRNRKADEHLRARSSARRTDADPRTERTGSGPAAHSSAEGDALMDGDGAQIVVKYYPDHAKPWKVVLVGNDQVPQVHVFDKGVDAWYMVQGLMPVLAPPKLKEDKPVLTDVGNSASLTQTNGNVYLVIDERGISSALFDKKLAHLRAEATEGVVAVLSIAADYRIHKDSEIYDRRQENS